MKMRIKKTKHQNGLKISKCLSLFKKLSLEAKGLVDEMEDADNDINTDKLAFVGSNKKLFNFNTFEMPLNFFSSIYNAQITLKR